MEAPDYVVKIRSNNSKVYIGWVKEVFKNSFKCVWVYELGSNVIQRNVEFVKSTFIELETEDVVNILAKEAERYNLINISIIVYRQHKGLEGFTSTGSKVFSSDGFEGKAWLPTLIPFDPRPKEIKIKKIRKQLIYTNRNERWVTLRDRPSALIRLETYYLDNEFRVSAYYDNNSGCFFKNLVNYEINDNTIILTEEEVKNKFISFAKERYRNKCLHNPSKLIDIDKFKVDITEDEVAVIGCFRHIFGHFAVISSASNKQWIAATPLEVSRKGVIKKETEMLGKDVYDILKGKPSTERWIIDKEVGVLLRLGEHDIHTFTRIKRKAHTYTVEKCYCTKRRKFRKYSNTHYYLTDDTKFMSLSSLTNFFRHEVKTIYKDKFININSISPPFTINMNTINVDIGTNIHVTATPNLKSTSMTLIHSKIKKEWLAAVDGVLPDFSNGLKDNIRKRKEYLIKKEKANANKLKQMAIDPFDVPKDFPPVGTNFQHFDLTLDANYDTQKELYKTLLQQDDCDTIEEVDFEETQTLISLDDDDDIELLKATKRKQVSNLPLDED